MATEEIRKLPFDLTDDELRDRGQEQARKVEERNAKAEAAKEAAKEAKKAIDKLDEEIADLSRRITSKVEHRPVHCQWAPDEQRATMNLARTDTGEIIESRAMTQGERQRILFGARDKVRAIAGGKKDGDPEVEKPKGDAGGKGKKK